MFKKFGYLFAINFIGVFGPPAIAADLLEPLVQPVLLQNWTGGYVGAGIGYAYGDVSLGPVANPDAARLSPSGFYAILQAGYDQQFNNNWVAGFRVMAPIASVEDDTFSVAAGGATIEGEGKYAAMLTGRLGYAVEDMLPYAFAGFAWGRGEAENAGCCIVEADHNGGIFGIGLEKALSPNWTIDIHYSYLFLDEANYDFTPFGGVVVSYGYDSHNFTLGVNYRF